MGLVIDKDREPSPKTAYAVCEASLSPNEYHREWKVVVSVRGGVVLGGVAAEGSRSVR